MIFNVTRSQIHVLEPSRELLNANAVLVIADYQYGTQGLNWIPLTAAIQARIPNAALYNFWDNSPIHLRHKRVVSTSPDIWLVNSRSLPFGDEKTFRPLHC